MNSLSIEKHDGEIEPEDIQAIRTIAKTAREEIQAEMNSTQNEWTACFATIVTGIKGHFDLFKLKTESEGPLPQNYSALEANVVALEKRLNEIRKEYPGGAPPQEIQEELLATIDTFR